MSIPVDTQGVSAVLEPDKIAKLVRNEGRPGGYYVLVRRSSGATRQQWQSDDQVLDLADQYAKEAREIKARRKANSAGTGGRA